MNTATIRRALVAAALLALALPGAAAADGTLSGTNIQNSATVDYKVGGVPQTPVPSDTASFVVDNKIDLLVDALDGAPVGVVPGDTMQVMTFEVTNEGNTTQDFSLQALDSATPAFGEPSEDFNATNVRVFVDANGNGTYDPGVDVATYIDELEPDSSQVVFVVVDIPGGQGDGDVASYDLIATAAVGGTATSQGADITSDDSGVADDPATVQIVFADDAGTADSATDGKHSDKDAVKVGSAVMTVSKTADVSDDPINGGTNPKAIPGATVDYSISVDNTGTVAATDVVVVDPIPANTAFLVGSTSSTPSAGVTIEYSNDNGNNWGYSPSAGTDGSDPAVTHVRVTFPSIGGGNSGTVDFQVLIL
jgi:uncharacterized repeat protein (TIGR01451 family)